MSKMKHIEENEATVESIGPRGRMRTYVSNNGDTVRIVDYEGKEIDVSVGRDESSTRTRDGLASELLLGSEYSFEERRRGDQMLMARKDEEKRTIYFPRGDGILEEVEVGHDEPLNIHMDAAFGKLRDLETQRGALRKRREEFNFRSGKN